MISKKFKQVLLHQFVIGLSILAALRKDEENIRDRQENGNYDEVFK